MMQLNFLLRFVDDSLGSNEAKKSTRTEIKNFKI